MKRILCIVLLFVSCDLSGQQNSLPSFDTPPSSLTVFSEGFISTHVNERDFAISPDGKEIYFTISTPSSSFQTIVFCRQVKPNEWTAPEVVSFAGMYSDLEPAFSHDGQTLYFASNRPVTGTKPKDFDIWKVERTANGWGEPVNLGSVINTESDEFYPSIAKSGNLYYTATYKGGPGREDIYVSEYTNSVYTAPVALDSGVNTKFYEFNAFVDPDEQYILFTSYGRKDDAGGGDLYMSVKDAKGVWQSAVNLKSLNSKQLDYCPYVSLDGRKLFITSNRHTLPTSFTEEKANYKTIQDVWSSLLNGTGNIFWIDFQKVRSEVKLTP
jgi:hypothetical protein